MNLGMGLTPRQRELLTYLQTRDTCPSFEEARRALGWSSKCMVTNALRGLEWKGYIRRLPNRARSIEVLRPITGGLRVVFGPEHFEMRAELKRAAWAQKKAA